MAPHYERPQASSDTAPSYSNMSSGPDDIIDAAAEALRQAEIEAVTPDDDEVAPASPRPERTGAAARTATTEVTSVAPSDLVNMSIDELRGVAAVLDVPDREKITEQDDLIEAIRRKLPR